MFHTTDRYIWHRCVSLSGDRTRQARQLRFIPNLSQRQRPASTGNELHTGAKSAMYDRCVIRLCVVARSALWKYSCASRGRPSTPIHVQIVIFRRIVLRSDAGSLAGRQVPVLDRERYGGHAPRNKPAGPKRRRPKRAGVRPNRRLRRPSVI